MHSPCDHSGFHSGEGRYDATTNVLRYVIVCDACGEELREVLVQPYVPEFIPSGSPAFVTA